MRRTLLGFAIGIVAACSTSREGCLNGTLKPGLGLVIVIISLFTWPYVVAFQFFVLMAWGIPRFVWRYVGMREATRILYATATSTAALLLVRFLSGELRSAFGYALYALIPTGVIIMGKVGDPVASGDAHQRTTTYGYGYGMRLG